MQSKVTAHEIQDMVRHWLRTPPNGYLGSSYGADIKALLQSPMSAGLADAFIDKMLEDVPILAALPAGTVNLYAEELSNDTLRLVIDLNGSLITVDNEGNVL